jgi:hypothetical protein
MIHAMDVENPSIFLNRVIDVELTRIARVEIGVHGQVGAYERAPELGRHDT